MGEGPGEQRLRGGRCRDGGTVRDESADAAEAAASGNGFRRVPAAAALEIVIEKAPRSTRKSVASWFTVGAAQEGGETSPGTTAADSGPVRSSNPSIYGQLRPGPVVRMFASPAGA